MLLHLYKMDQVGTVIKAENKSIITYGGEYVNNSENIMKLNCNYKLMAL